MACAVCGSDCALIIHDFHEGVLGEHPRRWSYIAPLYFKANAENTACEVPFCGVECAAAYGVSALVMG